MADSLLGSYERLRVSVTKGPDLGATSELSHLPLRVGGSAACELVISDSSAARCQCALESVPAGVRIRDEGSEGGVLLGKTRIFDVIASLPVEISLGESLLSIEKMSERVTRPQAASERFGDLLGRSARMRELFTELAQLATTEHRVFIAGERGTGRELVAESIHDASLRTGGPFVVVDCGNEERTLNASELSAAFERAESGTVYLHEVTSLSQALQSDVLSVLETFEVRGKGGQRAAPVDVRVLASSSKNVAAEVQRGNFRNQLWQLFSGSRVQIPPLRDRSEDLPLLVDRFARRLGGPSASRAIPRAISDLFASYRWPGNVQELVTAVQALVTTQADGLERQASSAAPEEPVAKAARSVELVPLRIARQTARDDFELDYLRALLARTQGNVTRAAAIAEVSRQMLQKLLRKHGSE